MYVYVRYYSVELTFTSIYNQTCVNLFLTREKKEYLGK